LTTIRGYAELYRQGALGPDQLPNAMRRIEQEADRMSSLVAELLELARLDRTSSLDLTETDLAGVVRDAVADAIAVEPDRPARAEAPPRLVAAVDEARIRQVLANLLGNVRAHTPPTAAVVVRLSEITGGVLIEVADAGPGMPAEDANRAFNRFHRSGSPAAGDDRDQGGNGADGLTADGTATDRWAPPERASGEPVQLRATGVVSVPRAARRSGGHAKADRSSGSGLGLSIVEAIANAHGGHATLESWPGRGTRVRVWLPVRIVSS
jgi:signal transduction histidine kinase